jgi:hypothetical protein
MKSKLRKKPLTTTGNKIFHAPATISIEADVSLDAPARARDSVRVEFYANTKRLGSRKSVWHEALVSNPRSRALPPMHIPPAGFGPVVLVWNNPPAGDYTLTARVSGAKARTAVSAPVNITILP